MLRHQPGDGLVGVEVRALPEDEHGRAEHDDSEEQGERDAILKRVVRVGARGSEHRGRYHMLRIAPFVMP